MSSELGLDRGHLEDPHGPAPHAVATPAEHHGVEPHRQDPLQQNLTLALVEEPAKEKVHQARRSYHAYTDKSKETQ